MDLSPITIAVTIKLYYHEERILAIKNICEEEQLGLREAKVLCDFLFENRDKYDSSGNLRNVMY